MYFFARELHKRLKVPIGIIVSSWSGTVAELWTPASGLKLLKMPPWAGHLGLKLSTRIF